MKTATTMPIQPSIWTPESRPISAPASTAEVAATSERESAAVAAMAAEPMRRESRRLKKDSHSLTQMEAARMATETQEKSTASGRRMEEMEDLPSSTPTRRMIRETSSPARYSMRPWPKGWPSSAFCPASRKPTSVTTEEAASVRLLRASAVMEMEEHLVRMGDKTSYQPVCHTAASGFG